ncbi:MAG: hypothetical protein WAL99_17145, partial [Pseudonocardiaceae bacterium]
MSEAALTIFRDARKAHNEGSAGIARRQCRRLTDQIAYVRARSRYYRELYQHLPEHIEDVTLLPVTNKQKLMERFDDWVTDPELTLEKIRAHTDDPDRVGEKLLGRYDRYTAWCHRVNAPPEMIPYCSPGQQTEGVIVSAGYGNRCRGAGSYL